MGQGSLLGPLGQDLGGVPAWADYQKVSREAAKANLMEAFQGASREVGAAQGGLGPGPLPRPPRRQRVQEQQKEQRHREQHREVQ